MNWHWWCSRLY